MKSYYRLVNYHLLSIIKPLMLIYAGTIASILILLSVAMQDYSNKYSRFEQLFVSSGCVIAFAVCFVATCGLCTASIYARYWKSKSIYTLLTLPVKREIIYFSGLTAFFICLAGFIASSLIGIFLGYAFFAPTLIRVVNNQIYYPRMQNGLFLALIRSGLFRMLIPLSAESFVLSLAMLITITITLYYGVICERSRRYFSLLTAVAAVIFTIYTAAQRINMSNANMYINSAILLFCSALFAWHGMQLVKRSSIV